MINFEDRFNLVKEDFEQFEIDAKIFQHTRTYTNRLEILKDLKKLRYDLNYYTQSIKNLYLGKE